MKIQTLITMLGISLLAVNSFAQDTRGTGPNGPVSGPLPPVRVGDEQVGKVIRPPVVRPDMPVRPDRPERPERPPLPPELKALLEKFETAREEYLKEQAELFKQLRGATEADREAIRAQIKEKREIWIEKTKEVREEIRKRLEELKDKLPTRREILDNAGPRPGTRPGTQ
jgi:hypothetical protein